MAFSSGARRYSAVLWLAGGSFAFVFCFYHLSATLVEGVFVPADHDSFYHARRILDALGDPMQVAQFDSRIHAPEGSWITWPWAYDAWMAVVARAGMALTAVAEPLKVLAFVAPAWVFVNAALFLGIASRLQLSLPLRVIAMSFFALSPLTQALHRVGMLDHHYVEYTFVLATIYFGLRWYERTSSVREAVTLGAVLGAAPAFQNGLFILQLPVLLTAASLWALRRPPDRRGTIAFALALAATTALFLLPSEPFRRGEFSFYLHSWFHLYVACCTGVFCVLAATVRATPASAAVLAAAAMAMAAAMVSQIELGRDFLFTRMPFHDRIGELGSIPRYIANGEFLRLTASYSPLLWGLPIILVALCWRLRRHPSAASLYFTVQALFGSFLLLQTFRLHYFGTFALILPLCRLVEDARAARPAFFRSAAGASALVLLAAAVVTPLIALRQNHPIGGERSYMLTRGIYPALQKACQEAPGVVLAEHGDGHHIRYHTDCAVIANNFLTTAQHVERIAFSEDLLHGTLEGVMQRAPYVRYILVRRADDVAGDARNCGLECPENAGLRRELLLREPASGGPIRLLSDIRYRRGDQVEPYARLFEIRPEPKR